MLSLSQIKYYIHFYRYNIFIPGGIGGIVLYDYLKLKKRRKLLEEKEARIAAKTKSKQGKN